MKTKSMLRAIGIGVLVATLAAVVSQLTLHASPLPSLPYEMLLFGGEVVGSPVPAVFGDTWRYDGSDWTLATSAGPTPLPRTRAGMVYDSTRNRILLFGGHDQTSNYGLFFNDTWQYAEDRWTQLQPPVAPSPRADPHMAYDSDRDVVVLWGGYDGPWDCSGVPNSKIDTWEFDGTTWRQIPTQHSPPRSILGAMVYDGVRHKIVLFTGWQACGFAWRNETWEYDGTDWVRTADGVLGGVWRYEPGLAFDAARQRVVLYGGYHHGGVCNLADTWEYDGAQWVRIYTDDVPPGRCAHAMAYDPGRQRVVMFGGFSDPSINRNDTWEYDGTNWHQVFTTSAPPARGFSVMAPIRFVSIIPATIDINPQTLNLKSKGRWITAYIELPDGYDVADIDVGTVTLADTISAEDHPTEVGDYDEDGITDLMVKFDRQALVEYLDGTTGEVTPTVSGELSGGTPFEGSDTITVINPGKK